MGVFQKMPLYVRLPHVTSGRGKYDIDYETQLLEIDEHAPVLTKAEELNIMISGEDESSSVLNGRLRPRKSTGTIPNPSNRSPYKSENKIAQDKSKKNSTPSKAAPKKQDDLTAKADPSPIAQLLCPYCDRKFSTKLAACKHARRIHLSTSKQDGFIECLFCSHSEPEQNGAIRHMVDSHPNQYFACLDCHTRFSSTSELAEHKLNVCEKQAYRSKLRQKTSTLSKKDQKKLNVEHEYPRVEKEHKLEPELNSLVISCELKPSQLHDADIEDKITTNLIMPSNKTFASAVLEKNAVIILDDIHWNRRIPPNFSFHNAEADQILSRLGVVHRSPRVGESTRREWLKMIDDTSQKFEKCFDTNFYSRVASNVQENLAKFLDGSFNFSPDPDKVIKTRKSKSSTIINTAEGFPILLPHEQYSRNRFDGYMPRAIAPKHKWKWDSTENDKNVIFDAHAIKRDNHVNNCIITLVSSLDIWTQLRMRRKFEGIYCKAPTEKMEKQNIIGRQLKEILESREIPCSSTQIVEFTSKPVAVTNASDFPSFLGLSAVASERVVPTKPAVLSGEWVRPRRYVCCACGDQTSEARALTAHMSSHHPNAQVQHYEIVGESLLNADILKHLYVPPSQMSNRTRPLRGFRDCTKCKKSVTLDDLHQHMLDCAGDTPTVRRKCRSRLFGVRRRRPRLPDNTIRKKIRKDLRARHKQKGLLRTRPRIRTEVGDAETIRKMIADLPAKRHRQASGPTAPVLRSRRKLEKQRNNTKIKRLTEESNARKTRLAIDTTIDEDDQPLKPKVPEKTVPTKKRISSRVVATRNRKKITIQKKLSVTEENSQNIAGDSRVKPQQLSCGSSSQRVHINGEGDAPVGAGDGDNPDGVDRGEGDDSDKQQDDPQNAPGPALLKHSINNITSSPTNKNSQLQQKNISPQQANNAETDHVTQNFLEKEIVVRPDKPPLATDQKRSCKKKQRSLHLKVQSLSNCIEKIAYHTISKNLKSDSLPESSAENNKMQTIIENAMPKGSLPDPNPAIVCTTRDEAGMAKNVVPAKIVRRDLSLQIQPDDSYGGYGETSRMYRRCSETDTARRRSMERFMVTTSENFRKSSDCEFVSPKPIISGEKRYKSFAHSDYEQANPMLLQQSDPWLGRSQVGPAPYLLEYHRLEYLPKTHHETPTSHQNLSAFQNYANRYPVPNLNFAPSAYSPPDLRGQDRRENITRNIPQPHQLTPQLLNCQTQQNSMISPLSPQLWNTQSTHTIYPMPSMMPSILLSSPSAYAVIPTQTSRKRVSESSETDNYRNYQIDSDTSMLNLRRHSAETGNLDFYSPYSEKPKAPKGLEKCPDYLLSMQDGPIGLEKRYTASPQDGQMRLERGPDNNVPNDEVRTNRMVSNQENNNVKTQTSEKHNSMIEGVHPIVADDIIKRCFKIRNQKIAEAEAAFSLSINSMRKSIDMHDENNYSAQTNLPIVTKELIAPKKQTVYEAAYEYTGKALSGDECHEAFEDEFLSDCGLTNEPLDLSGKNVIISLHNETEETDSNILDEPCVTLDLTKKPCKLINDEIKATTPGFQPRNGNHEQVAELRDCVWTDTNQGHDTNRGHEPANWSFNEINDEGAQHTHDKHPNIHPKGFDESLVTNEENHEAQYSAFTQSKSKQASGENRLTKTLISNISTSNPVNNINDVITSTAWDKRNTEETSVHEVGVDSKLHDLRYTLQVNYKTSPSAYGQSKSYQGCYPEKNTIMKDVLPASTTTLRTQNSESKNKESTFGEINVNETNMNSSSFEQDPETAKKIAMFPKELVAILGAVPKEKKSEFVNVISQFVANPPLAAPAASHEIIAPIITVPTLNDLPQCTEYKPAKANTLPIFDTSTNSNNDNRLTINTAVFPSSSILPKKRHSPSARLNLRDAYNNSISSLPNPPSTSITSTESAESKLSDLSPKNGNAITDSDTADNMVLTIDSCYKQTSTDIIKKMFSADESESKNRIGNIIDLTDDDDVHLKTDELSATPSTSALPSQESVFKPNMTTKHSSEQTANLRAVRIKNSLSRKSISDDKMPTCTKASQPPIYDFRQRDLNTAQLSKSECSSRNDQLNNIIMNVNHDPKYLSQIPINEVQNTALQNVTTDEISKINLAPVPTARGRLDRSETSVVSSMPFTDKSESANVTMPYIRQKQFDDYQVADTKNNTGKSHNKITDSQSFLDLPDNDRIGIIQNQDSHPTSPLSGSCNEQESVISKMDVIKPLATVKKNDIFLQTENNQSIVLTGQKNDFKNKLEIPSESLGLVLNINEDSLSIEEIDNVTSTVLKNEIMQHDMTKIIPSRVKSSETEDSEDDILLAVIVKQKQLEQISTLSNEASTSNVSVNKSEIITKQKDNQKVLSGKSPEKELLSTKSSLVDVNNKHNNTVIGEERLIMDINNDLFENSSIDQGLVNGVSEPIENDNQVSNAIHRDLIHDLDNNKNNDQIQREISKCQEGTSENNIERATEDVSSITDNIVIEEPISVSVSNGSVRKLTSKNKKPHKKSRKRKIKPVHVKRNSISKNTIEKQSDNNDFELHSKVTGKTNSNSFSTADDNNLTVKSNSSVSVYEVLKGEIKLQEPQFGDTEENSNQSRTRKKILRYSETIESTISDSELSTALKDNKNQQTLRRSKRGKSMNMDDASETEHDNSANNLNAAKVANIPVTKKQLIFSRLLQDENMLVENNIHESIDEIGDTSSETEAINKESTKRKKSPTEVTKNKKIKARSNEINDVEYSNLNNSAPNNSIVISEKQYTSHDPVATAPDISFDSGVNDSEDVLNSCDATTDTNTKSTVKRKVDYITLKNTTDGTRAKRSKSVNKNDIALVFKEREPQTNRSTSNYIEEEETEHIPVRINSSVNKLPDFSAPEDCNDSKKSSDQALACSETRTACYNRPIVNKNVRSFSDSVKNTVNYDPYDIDFEDMAEATMPIMKRKNNKTGNSKSSKRPSNIVQVDTARTSRQETDFVEIVQTSSEATKHNISDSDSSIKNRKSDNTIVSNTAAKTPSVNRNTAGTSHLEPDNREMLQVSIHAHRDSDSSIGQQVNKTASCNTSSMATMKLWGAQDTGETSRHETDIGVRIVHATTDTPRIVKDSTSKAAKKSSNTIESVGTSRQESDIGENLQIVSSATSHQIPDSDSSQKERKENKTVSVTTVTEASDQLLSITDAARTSQESDIDEIEQLASEILSQNISDSDSSISDVPLQKYVEEKEKIIAEGLLGVTDCNGLENEPEQNTSSIVDDIDMRNIATQSVEDSNHQQNENHKNHITAMNASSRDAIDQINVVAPAEIDNIGDSNSNIQNQDTNQMDLDCPTVQPNTKQKRNRRSTSTKIEYPSVSNKIDQQLSSDKFMENFGFYNTRIPRKSNLLASKKISETFRETDDAFFRTKDRQKKSTHNDTKRVADGPRTSKESTKGNTERKSLIEQPSTSSVAETPSTTNERSTTNEPHTTNDDEEVDLITAQRILESEEVRKLENDLFSGLKEAANANAGQTFRLSHLRADERKTDEVDSPSTFTPIENSSEIETVATPGISKKTIKVNTKKPPEYKELMYPDEEVNIYEDKYDIIKRRRTQAAAAKQTQSVDEPRTSAKNRKKPERKNNRKGPKKQPYQISQVPTKGALKGFDGIKVSIPTQDLVLPPNVSPPSHQHKQAKPQVQPMNREKNLGHGCKSESDRRRKNVDTPDKDIYEFEDDERPFSQGYRLKKGADKIRSSSCESEDKNEKRERKEIATKFQNEKDTPRNVSEQQKRNPTIKGKYKGKGKGKGKGKRTNSEDNGESKEKATSQIVESKIRDLNPAQNNDADEVGDVVNAENNRLDSSRMNNESILSSADPVPSSHDNISGNFENVDNSDIDEQMMGLPGTSGFVPDRNDESSYESDSSAPQFPDLDYACTCPSDVDSDDSEIETGCANTSCRYIHLNAAKNAVMDRIFKNNALRCDRSYSPRKSPKPKPDLDLLFDSLLEQTTTINATTARTPASPVPGPSWASDYYYTNEGKEMSNVDDGFSSPNRPGSEKTTEKAFAGASPPTVTEMQPFDFDDDCCCGSFTEATRELTEEERSTVVSLQRIGDYVMPLAPVTIPPTSVDNSETIDINTIRNAQSQKRRRGDDKTPKTSRKSTKKHKPHHRRKKGRGDEDGLEERNDDSGDTITLRQTRRTLSSPLTDRGDTNSNRHNDRESPSRKSDEGISTSHDNSADAYDLGRDEDTGVVRQRARRKCTVGKQNVLVEHWSSSDSETNSCPMRGNSSSSGAAARRRRGRKLTMGRKNTRYRRRGAEDSDCSERAGPSTRAVTLRSAPGPSLRARPAARGRAPRYTSSCDSSVSRDRREQDIHGWIVGKNQKKVVSMLVYLKVSGAGEDDDDDSDDEEEDYVRNDALGNEDEEASEVLPAEAEDSQLAEPQAEEAQVEEAHAEQVQAELMRMRQTRAEQVLAEQVLAEQTQLEESSSEQGREEQPQAEQLRLERERAEQLRFQQARVEQELFEQVRAEQAQAEQLRLEQTRLEQERAEQLRFEQARAEQAQSENARVEQARAEQVQLEQAQFERALAEQAQFEQAQFEQARLEQAQFDQARMEQAQFEQARIEQAQFEQARAEQAQFEQARAEHALFERARSEHVRFEQSLYEQARAEQAQFEQARAGQRQGEEDDSDEEESDEETTTEEE